MGKWTTDNTEGFDQETLNTINYLRDKLIAEASPDALEQLEKSLDNAINNAWTPDKSWSAIEADVRDAVGL